MTLQELVDQVKSFEAVVSDTCKLAGAEAPEECRNPLDRKLQVMSYNPALDEFSSAEIDSVEMSTGGDEPITLWVGENPLAGAPEERKKDWYVKAPDARHKKG